MGRLLDAIREKRALVGTIVSMNSCELAEALSESGLDWLFFDLEHSVLSLQDVQCMIQAMNKKCMSFIRIQDPQTAYVKKALDTGCDGIIVPQVNSALIAKQVIEAGKYAPLGARSVGLSRSIAYGTNLANGIKFHNDEKAIIVQIEHIQAIQNLDEILNVPGIDGVFVGPYDLSSSMGVIGEVSNKRVQESIEIVVSATKKRGIPAGIFIGGESLLKKEIERGYQLIAVGSDILRLVSSCQRTAEVRDDSISQMGVT